VLTSDAHQASELERARYAALNAERAGLPPEQVVNAGPTDDGGAALLRWSTQAQVPVDVDAAGAGLAGARERLS
jgi:hypothetical protein